MIYRIDLLNTNQPSDCQVIWEESVEELKKIEGFKSAELLRVYKNINRSRYDLVSIIEWANRNNYQTSTSYENTYAFLPPGQLLTHNNIYEVINSGAQTGVNQAQTNFVVTNPYRISEQESDINASMWDQSKEHMLEKQGFVNARLYKRLDETAQYYFFSRANWQSEALFMSQFDGKDFKEIISQFEDTFSICFSNSVVSTTKKEIPA
ncbi:antibiotic biosynthesis monooxygenase family protein [Pseudoalteromonas luteoviolacea]|uniref:ABM domain-containing protein n=1 Tax=Pseudoalteromonas luteoviolacea NCIMB 1942 TaxID=1365253 RepID=A0A166Y929_9GAMM|nr:hypothetical protein [Pseudoalteromonas luteoviolacea]KZN41574.1 hypothetical protein N482_20060 [Pseudoalteromonas luteoviolacea NCIMB 1942]KZW98461.1 hypothetical protein JL49_23320 [Pseudoalteromonas luteoviolacea]